VVNDSTRVLYLGLGWKFTGGIATLARSTLAALSAWANEPGARRRVEVMTLHDEPTPDFASTGEIAGASVSIRSYSGSRWRMALALAARMRLRRYDLVVCEHVNLMPMVAAAVPAETRCVCFIYSFEIWYGLSAMRAKGLRRAGRLIAISHAAAARTRQMKLRMPPINVCHPGLADPMPGMNLQRMPGADPIVLTVGRMMISERHKNHRCLLRAMADVVREVPEARLVIVGDGDDRAEIARFGTELGLDGHLLFTGAVSAAELDRWYRGAQVFAMPAEREGFGLVYLEAMGRGLPVVAGSSGASLEIIDDGRSGFLVAPDDHRALGRRIVRLFHDRHLQAAVGSAARARFVEQFTTQQYAARLYPILGLETSTKEEAQTGTAA